MSLSNFISQLERSGELQRISAYVDPAFEMADIADRCSKNASINKALLFTNNGTDFPTLMNMMGSKRRMCMALGVQCLSDIPQRIDNILCGLMHPKLSIWDKLKLLPTLRQAARWLPKHTSIPNNRVKMLPPDLNMLPITTSWAADGGRFITLPMVHTQDLHTGVRNVGMYRMQVFDGQTTAMHWHIHKTGARHYLQYKEAGRRMPVAVTLGGNPIYTYCATAPLPDGVDEYLLAGFLQGKPVRLMPCLTQPLYVPEDTDFVIEGYVDPQEDLVMEGPFGDHTGFYSLPDLYPMFHVTAITHRRDAVYPATLVGIPPQEDAYIAMATECIFLPLIRFGVLPEIEDIYMPCEGVAHNLAIVSIKKRYAGQAQKTANALWGAGQMMFNKILVVVDDAVNIRDTESLLHLATDRFNPDTDIYYGQGALDILDHATQKCGYGGKMCIDLTKKDDTADSAYNKIPLFAFIHRGDKMPQARIAAEFDKTVDVSNLRICLWLLGSNIDPVRDCKTVDGQLLIDATSKPHKTLRQWPDIVSVPKETIERIDSKWDTLGIGKFVPSPSEQLIMNN